MSSSKRNKLLYSQALLLEGLLELSSREVLSWESVCCIWFLCIYPTCVVQHSSEIFGIACKLMSINCFSITLSHYIDDHNTILMVQSSQQQTVCIQEKPADVLDVG